MINIQDNEGRTSLHIAVLAYITDQKDPSKSINYYDIVKKLLNVPNVDTDIIDNEGKSVHCYVSECRDKELIDLFIKHYRKKNRRHKA